MKRAMFRERMKAILVQEWDPIGIKHNQNLGDEYGIYALELLSYTQSVKLTQVFIENYLKQVEEDIIGLTVSQSARVNTAKKILEILNKED